MLSLEYAAGLLDGEGYIIVYLANKKYWRLRVGVDMSTDLAIREMSHTFEGCCTSIKPHGMQRSAMHWTWQITGERAKHFLQDVRPFLLVKAEQADVAIEFQSSRSLLSYEECGQYRAQLQALRGGRHGARGSV